MFSKTIGDSFIEIQTTNSSSTGGTLTGNVRLSSNTYLDGKLLIGILASKANSGDVPTFASNVTLPITTTYNGSNLGSMFASNVSLTTYTSNTQATNAALATKASSNSPTFTGNVTLPITTTYNGSNIGAMFASNVSLTQAINDELATKAPSESPTFTGEVTLPIDTYVADVLLEDFILEVVAISAQTFTGDVSLPITTTYNGSNLGTLIASNVLLTTYNSNTQATNAALATKASSNSPTFTGDVSLPITTTYNGSNIGTMIASNVLLTTYNSNTQATNAALATKASSNSPTFTGNVTLPYDTTYFGSNLLKTILATATTPTFTGNVTLPITTTYNGSNIGAMFASNVSLTTYTSNTQATNAVLATKAPSDTPTFTGDVTLPIETYVADVLLEDFILEVVATSDVSFTGNNVTLPYNNTYLGSTLLNTMFTGQGNTTTTQTPLADDITFIALKNLVNSSNTKYDRLSNAVNSSNTRYDALSNAVNSSNIRYDALSSLVNSSNTKYDRLLNAVNSSNIRYDALSNAVNSSNIRYDALSNSVSASNIRYDAVSTAVSASNIRYDALSNLVNSSNTKYDRLSNAVSASNIRYDALSNLVSDSNTKYDRLLNAVNSSNTRYDALSNAVNSSNIRYDALSTIVSASNIKYDGVIGSQAIQIPKGTTLQRPSESLSVGGIRYNTNTSNFEGCYGAAPSWKSIGNQWTVDTSNISYNSGNVSFGTGLVGIGTTSLSRGPFMKQSGWTGVGSSHILSDFYVADNSSGSLTINVKCTSTTPAKNGTANVSFVKTERENLELFVISMHTSSNLQKLDINVLAPSNIKLDTDNNCSVCWTSIGAC